LAGIFGLKKLPKFVIEARKENLAHRKIPLTDTFQKSNDQKLGINSKFHENLHPKKN